MTGKLRTGSRHPGPQALVPMPCAAKAAPFLGARTLRRRQAPETLPQRPLESQKGPTMADNIRDFISSMPSAGAKTAGPSNAPATGAGTAPPTGAGTPPPATDDSGLVSGGDTAGVSFKDDEVDQGGELKPGIDYDFYAYFQNVGKHKSGPCFVKFTLTGEQNWHKEFDLPDGLDAGADVRAYVNYGKFPDKWASYDLEACIYSKSNPDKKIVCAGTYGLLVTP
jgi:hypothetical protein